MAKNKKFEQMPEEEKDKLASEVFMGQFLFAKTVVSAFCGEIPEKDEIIRFIMKESNNELEKYMEKNVIYQRR